MAFALAVSRGELGAIVMLATAVLIWFGTGLDPSWPLMWLAPVPVLLYARDASARSAALAAGGAMILGTLNIWGLLHGALHLPRGLLVRIYLTEGLVYALAVLLYRALVRRRAHRTALLAFPALLVSFEWFLNLAAPHGTGGSLAYSQLRFLPFLQLASITGPWGMSFLLAAFPAALALAIGLRREGSREGYRIVGTTAAVLAAVLVFGLVRLSIPPGGVPATIGLVAADGPNEYSAQDGAPTEQLFAAYAAPVAALALQHASVVVLPEKVGEVLDSDIDRFDAALQAVADESHVRVVAGVLRVVPPGVGHPTKLRYNEARVYTPGAPVATYDKEHMLPPFESNITPGTSLTLLRSSSGPELWGVAICKDMDFTQLSRRYGEAGAGLMLVPAWDFFLDWIQHGHMAVMRGVESGFSVVRSAKGGSLFASDDRGRILGEIKSDAAPFSSLLVSVPQTHDRTLFLRLGDWFAWVAVALLALCLVQLVRSRVGRPAHGAGTGPAPG
jgi:apolipoprotein N-acyltransferase